MKRPMRPDDILLPMSEIRARASGRASAGPRGPTCDTLTVAAPDHERLAFGPASAPCCTARAGPGPSDLVLSMSAARARAAGTPPPGAAALHRLPPRTPTPLQPGFTGGSPDKAAFPPDPARPGPFPVCACLKMFSAELNGVTTWFRCKVYLPGTLRDENTCFVSGRHPLVLIYHADGVASIPGNEEDYLEYDLLGSRLASHGYVVSSVCRFTSTDMFKSFSEVANPDEWIFFSYPIDWLYSQIGSILTDDIALFGHSAGGNTILNHIMEVLAPRKVAAVVLLAPTIPNLPTSAEKLSSHTPAVLGFNMTEDEDGQASGSSAKPPVVAALTLVDMVKDVDVTRDGVFFHGHHYTHSSSVVMAYTTAFLGLHVKGMQSYRPIFKLKARPAGLAKDEIGHFVQNHSEPAAKKRRVVDFDTTTPVINVSPNITGQVVDLAWKLNAWATAGTNALWFRWQKNIPPTDFLRLSIAAPVSPLGFRWIALRMCQAYDKTLGNISGIDRDAAIWVITSAQSRVQLGSVTMPFPYVLGDYPDDRRKTVFSSFVLPLADLLLKAPSESIAGIEFDFATNPSGNTLFMIGDIELWT